MIRINLLPKETRDKGKGTEWVILAALVLVLFGLLGAGSYGLKKRRYEKDAAKKMRWSGELAEIKKKVDRVTELDNQRNLLNAKKNTVVQLLQGRILYPIFMEHVYQTLPKDVWLNDLKLTEAGDKSIVVEAKSESLTVDSVADWLETLESRTDRFGGVDLSAIDIKGDAKAVTYSFTIKFTYRPPAGS